MGKKGIPLSYSPVLCKKIKLYGFPCVTYISFNVGRHKKDANTVKISCTRIRVPWFKIGKFTESKTLMNNLCLYTNNSWLVEKVLSWDPSLYRCLKTRNMKTSSRNAKSPYYHSFNTKFRTSYIIFFRHFVQIWANFFQMVSETRILSSASQAMLTSAKIFFINLNSPIIKF